MEIANVFKGLGLHVLERGWLSCNSIVFGSSRGEPATVIDTGYVSHAQQTQALIDGQLAGAHLGRVLNTHLHSDHCGGNAELQSRWACEVWIPEASFGAVAGWQRDKLSFDETGQKCPPFSASTSLNPGDRIRIGHCEWEIIAAPGHDPDAVMFFEPMSKVMITGDALWQSGLAIVFPELKGQAGYGAARSALDAIEALQPKIVIPGHGKAFSDVAAALAQSRERISHFEAHPARHARYAARALTMFHMLGQSPVEYEELLLWLSRTPLLLALGETHFLAQASGTSWQADLIEGMVRDGLLKRSPRGSLQVGGR